MLARSVHYQINLQKEIQWGLYVAEALLLTLAAMILVRGLFLSKPPAPQVQTVRIESTPAPAENSLYHRAKEKLEQRDYLGAITLLNAAIELAATPQAELFHTRATAYQRLGDYAAATRDYQQAVSIDRNNSVYHTSLCYTAAQMGDLHTASVHCDNAVRLAPQDWLSWNDRCYLRAYQTGDYAGAVQDCNQAVTLNSTHPYPYNNRARAYLMAGNYTEAIADASRSLEFGNPFPALPYTTRGTAFQALGNYEQARVDFQAALAADPGYPEVHFRLGEFYRLQGQNANARASFCAYIERAEHPVQYALDRASQLGGCGG